MGYYLFRVRGCLIIFTHPFIIFFTACGAGIITYAVIPVIIHLSYVKKLVDEPNQRKLHADSMPNLGGIALFTSAVLFYLISGYAVDPWTPYLLAGLILLFFSGLKDDILIISANKKLLLQLVAIGFLVFGGDIIITDFGGIFGIHAIPYWAGAAITFFTMVVVLNAYNLIDGIDGLAGGVGVIASLFFGAWFFAAGLMGQAALAFTLAGALSGFLCYNFQPASIFMGDSGSQVVGYLLAFFAVSFVQTGVNTVGSVLFQHEVPVLILAVLIVPLYDTLRVFSIRVVRGHSPFHPDRRHVHHQLVDCGFSHRSSCLIIYGFNLFIMGLVMMLPAANINILFAVVLLSAMILFPTVHFKRTMLKKLGVEMPSEERIHTFENKMMLIPSPEVKTEEDQPKQVAV